MNSQNVVVDTSVIVKWLVAEAEPRVAEADALLRDREANRIKLFAPELAKYEVGNVLLKGKALEPRAVASAHASLYSLPIHFVTESHELAGRTYALAYRHRLTYYDAAFPALAESLHATLVTDNVKHQGKAATIPVIPLAEYGTRHRR